MKGFQILPDISLGDTNRVADAENGGKVRIFRISFTDKGTCFLPSDKQIIVSLSV
jgi:hypothetical protein